MKRCSDRPWVFIETSGNQKEQCLENKVGGVKFPIYAFPSRFPPVLQHWADRWHAAKSTSLGFNSFGTQCTCKRLERVERSTPDDSISPSYVWHGFSSSNVSHSSSSIFFGWPGLSFSSVSKSPLLESLNLALTCFNRCSIITVSFRKQSMTFSSIFLRTKKEK